MKAITEKTNGAPSAVESIEGNANNHESSEEMKFCAHRGHGCISQNGYLCFQTGPCQPMDSNGRRFVVHEWIENGQRLATRHHLDDHNGIPLKRGNKAVCSGRCMCQPENHAGKGACGKELAPIIVGS